MMSLRGKAGGGSALALCFGGALAALVLLPATQLLDLKAVAAMAWASLFCFGLAWTLPNLGQEALRRPPLDLSLAWTAALGAFLSAWALSPYRALLGSDSFPSLGAGVLVCFALAAGPKSWLVGVLRLWPWATLALALYALAQRLGLEPMASYAQAGSHARAMGSFGNPGYLAAYLCLSWPLLTLWPAPWKWGALVLVFAALVATQSRAGLAALAVQLAVGSAVKRRRSGSNDASGGALSSAGSHKKVGRLERVLGIGLGLGGAGLLLALCFPPSQWLRPTLRWSLWKAAVDLWLQRPLVGWGPGSFVLAFQEHAAVHGLRVVNAGNQFAEDPHQCLLALVGAGGGLALAVFAFMAWVFIRRARHSRLQEASALGLGALGLFVQSQADRFFFQPGVFVPLCAVFGTLAWSEAAVPPPPPPPMTGGAKARLGAVQEWTALALAALGCFFAWKALLPILRYRQGVGLAMDEGVRTLASAGDPSILSAQAEAGADPSLWERLGDAYAAQHRYDQAAQALAKALALAPSRGRAQNLGNCYMMLGDVPRAERAFRRAVALDPSNADAHFSLGYALFYQKRLKDAVGELDTALRLNPDHAGAAQLKRQILQ